MFVPLGVCTMLLRAKLCDILHYCDLVGLMLFWFYLVCFMAAVEALICTASESKTNFRTGTIKHIVSYHIANKRLQYLLDRILDK